MADEVANLLPVVERSTAGFSRPDILMEARHKPRLCSTQVKRFMAAVYGAPSGAPVLDDGRLTRAQPPPFV